MMPSANSGTLTYGASTTATSGMSYQMQGPLTMSNQAVTYPTVMYQGASPSTIYQAQPAYQSPMTYQASSYVQTGMSPVGATFDTLDQNHDGVITRQEFSTMGQ